MQGLSIDNDGRHFGLSWETVRTAIKNNVSEPNKIDIVPAGIGLADLNAEGYELAEKWW